MDNNGEQLIFEGKREINLKDKKPKKIEFRNEYSR